MYLLIEFLDEMAFGIGETAWPLIRTDLHLTYTQIGLLAHKLGLGMPSGSCYLICLPL